MSLAASPPLHRFPHEAMGTMFEAVIAGEEETARSASQAVFREIDRLEALLTRFNPGSDVGQINALRPGQVVRVGVETYECLKTAEEIRLATGGAFDINFRVRAGRNRRAKTQDSADHPGYELLCGPNGFAVRRPGQRGDISGPGLEIDLGGIGKGFALDMVRPVLLEWGVEGALIHSGTSTALALGSAPGAEGANRGWPVGAGGFPALPGIARRVLLEDRALSGSGTEVRGRHIIDPKTGRPADSHLAAWVSHPSAAGADALSTAFVVMTTEDVEDYCRRHPETWALVIPKTGIPAVFNSDVLPTLRSSA